MLAANAPRQQEAIDEYNLRRRTLASYLWHAFVGYWVVPAATLFVIGVLIGGIRRALRRPPANQVASHVVPGGAAPGTTPGSAQHPAKGTANR
ncbi:hypothetical protein PBS_11810 [Paraburkholderia sp. 2C]